MVAPRKSAEPTPQNRIGEFRKLHGLSFAEIGERCRPPATASEVRKVEIGDTKLNLDWMRRIAPAFGVRPGELLSDGDAEIDSHERHLIRAIRVVSSNGVAPVTETVSNLVSVMNQIHVGAIAGKSLPGDPELASRMGTLWASADDAQRRKILEITDIARAIAPS